MPYYDTLAEDVKRAKEILEKGKAESRVVPYLADELIAADIKVDGGTIYGCDTFAAYKLLESFVAVIEELGIKPIEVVLEHKRAAEALATKKLRGE